MSTFTKPQSKFRIPIDNSLDYFLPNIREKPNALVPLDISPISSKKGKIKQAYKNPYEYEINNFVLNSWQFEANVPVSALSLDQTDIHFIDTLDYLKQIVAKLKTEQELAVDLEGHIWRSFQGLTCIIQLSTRNCDYIIDSLELRDDLYLLNEIFTDPNILKVFHGSSSDVKCLQRDFSVFVVNMFDTLEAAKYLQLETLSLQALVKSFCNIDLDKTLRAKTDWRIRPLTAEQMLYARQDTHYLLYIYDNLRNQLINRSQQQLINVYDKCRDLCKLIYEKPKQINEVAFSKRFESMFNEQQLRVLKMLVIWRERYARDNDESLAYVLPESIMLEMVKTLPENTSQLLECCQRFTPKCVSKNKEALVRLIQEALQ